MNSWELKLTITEALWNHGDGSIKRTHILALTGLPVIVYPSPLTQHKREFGKWLPDFYHFNKSLIWWCINEMVHWLIALEVLVFVTRMCSLVTCHEAVHYGGTKGRVKPLTWDWKQNRMSSTMVLLQKTWKLTIIPSIGTISSDSSADA